MLSNWEQFQFVIGLGSWFDAVFFGLAALLPPVWFAARTTASPLARRALRLLLAVALLWAVAFLVLAAIMLALADRGGTLVLLLLLPLGVVYGLRKGRRARSRASARGGGTTAAALLLLPVPLLVSAALGVALLDYAIGEGTVADLPFDPFGPASDGTVPDSIWTGNGVLDAALGALRLAGYGALYVFFLSIPYVVGSILAAALLILDGLGWKAPLRVPSPAPAEDDAEPEVNMTRRALTIAIDGPAAAGKGTLAKRLAARYGLPYLDTGLLYRAVGRKAADLGLDLDDPDAAGAVARALTPSALDDGTLRGREAGELASRVAAHPSVRAALNDFQRDFARRPEGAVLDGRDIGTVIAPDASVKIFVTASAEVRARRRDEELVAKGRASDFERILAEVRERDARDAGRSVAPLKPAPDAHLLDTSELDIDAVFQAACMLIDRVLADPE